MVQAQVQDDVDDPGQHVHVLVAVRMGGHQSRIQEPVQLGGAFPLHILEPDLAGKETFHESTVVRIQFPGGRIHQTWDFRCRQDGSGIYQGEMDAHPQGGGPASQFHRLCKGGAGDHDRGRPDQSPGHSLFHRPVDQGMAAEIISIDNQLFGHGSHPFQK